MNCLSIWRQLLFLLRWPLALVWISIAEITSTYRYFLPPLALRLRVILKDVDNIDIDSTFAFVDYYLLFLFLVCWFAADKYWTTFRWYAAILLLSASEWEWGFLASDRDSTVVDIYLINAVSSGLWLLWRKLFQLIIRHLRIWRAIRIEESPAR